jgi:futalosine hydrolase
MIAVLPAASLGLLQADDFPYRLGGIEADTPFFDYSNLRKVQSITVQQVTGSEDSIYRMRQTWPQADIENMEGLAVFYVSKKTGIPCAAIRTISNRVEPRNRDNWKIQEAILNLNQLLINLFSN